MEVQEEVRRPRAQLRGMPLTLIASPDAFTEKLAAPPKPDVPWI